MKRERHGRAKILSPTEIQLLFNQGLDNLRDRALFGFCLYTACRINEACTQLTCDAYERTGTVRPEMTIRKGNSKGKLASRTIPTSEDLSLLLAQYRPQSGDKYLFPGRWNRGHIHPDSASYILRQACRRLGLEGVSTHSFRRTALTTMSDAAIPFRVIAEISGHHNLTQLHAYLEVKPAQVKGAIASLSQLSYIGKSGFPDLDTSNAPKNLLDNHPFLQSSKPSPT
jgi:integrase/recombinase XerD